MDAGIDLMMLKVTKVQESDIDPLCMEMLTDIKEGKDKVDFVLVFKLLRFGRNAADVLVSLQIMKDYGVNLICVEDGIDSSKDA